MTGAVEYTELHLCSGVKLPPPNKCHGYDTKPSDHEAKVLELWEFGVPLHNYYSQVHSDLEW